MLITIEVEVEKTSGPFASRDAIGEALAGMLDVGSVSVDDSEYEVVNTNVLDQPKRGKR